MRQGGWRALSMQGLAAAAGVSRQLVYEHFPTADDLAVQTLTHLFERAHGRAEAIVRAGRPLDETLRAAMAQVLDLPPEERSALRTLAVEINPGQRGLARAQARLRTRIVGIWAPFVRAITGSDASEATALAWTLTTAAWGLCDSVTDGTLSRGRALDLFVRIVTATLKEARS